MMFRSVAGSLRRRAEGFVFAGLALVMAPLCLLLCRHGRRVASVPGVRRRRWRCFLLGGLRALRETWWVALSLEPVRHVWRYVFFCELLDRRGRPERPKYPRKSDTTYLLVNLGHLGDMLHTVPTLRAIRRLQPRARIHLLTGPWNKDIADRLGYVDACHYYAPRWDALSRGHADADRGWGQEFRQLLALVDIRADWMISCSSGNLVDLCLALAAQPAHWVGADCRPTGLYAPDIAWHIVPYATRESESKRLLNLLGAAGIEADDDRLEVPITREDRARAAELLRAAGLSSTRPRVVVAPGAGWPGKVWPEERFAEVAKWLAGDANAAVLVVGSRSESALCARVAGSQLTGLVNFAGQTSVGELAALLEESDLFIGNDSGPLHVAAALGKPTLSIFGPGFPEKWAPTGPQHRLLHHPSGCPCFPWHPAAKCERADRCIDAVTIEEVKQAATELLSRRTLIKEPLMNADGHG